MANKQKTGKKKAAKSVSENKKKKQMTKAIDVKSEKNYLHPDYSKYTDKRTHSIDQVERLPSGEFVRYTEKIEWATTPDASVGMRRPHTGHYISEVVKRKYNEII